MAGILVWCADGGVWLRIDDRPAPADFIEKMKRSAPMKRTAFKSKSKSAAPKAEKAPRPSREGAKSAAKQPKRHREGYLSQKHLDACKGQPCYLRIPFVCGGEAARDTVVPAHSNQAKHGKGMGIKSKDFFTVPGCFHCHTFIDQGSASRADKFWYWDDAYARWQKDRAKLMGENHEQQ